MPTPDFSNLGKLILEKVKLHIADVKLTPEEKVLLQEIADDAPFVVIHALSGDPVKAVRAKRDIEAQLAGFTSIETSRLSRVFWRTFSDVLRESLGFIIALV